MHPARAFLPGGTNGHIATGDFNGDGIPDFAVTNGQTVPGGPDGTTIAIFLGVGVGGFIEAAGSPIRVGRLPYTIQVADFDVDGNLDLAVDNADDNSVTILLGNGAGQFSQAPGSPFLFAAPGVLSGFMVVGDFNGDGIPDIAASDRGVNTVVTLLGNGTGGFIQGSAVVGVGSTSNVLDAVAADFNGDGLTDIAFIDSPVFGFGGLGVLLGNRAGGFTLGLGYPGLLGMHPAALGDK